MAGMGLRLHGLGSCLHDRYMHAAELGNMVQLFDGLQLTDRDFHSEEKTMIIWGIAISIGFSQAYSARRSLP